MENFVVSARKYRPSTFDTVVGQLSITTTLKNAIKNNHLAQAFLFCGPRGVGKTTCARILAKTINCFNRTANIEACDECESCKSFNNGSLLNVDELDAASNNSVDDIRNLVDKVRVPPQLGSHKVYIVDEVHMLSQAAFNAFLKTLEEPPKHAIFILATTEKHKIIPTILSRCQIFDFNRIQIDDIAKHLAEIAVKENITAEPDALHIIAQKADGALRDALSMFDQLVSFAGTNLTYKAVVENLNVLDYDYYFKVVDAVVQENIPTALLLFDEILNNGFDGHNFITGLGEHFRNLLVCKDISTLQLLEVGVNIKDKYKEQSQKLSVPLLLKGLGIINKHDLQYKGSKNQRLQVEIALMQLCSINADAGEKKEVTNIKPPLASVAAPAPVAKQPIANIPVTVTAPKAEIKSAPAISMPSEKKTPVKNPSISISQFVNPAKDQKKTTDENKELAAVSEATVNYFSDADLQTAWSNYARPMQSSGKMNLYSTLTSRKPILKESGQIELVVENKVQEELMNEEKTDLLGFLRKELKNYGIQLVITLNKLEGEKKIYTSQDKYKRMAEKNPAITKLKQQFDLDIDF